MPPADRLTWRTSSSSSNGENCVEVAPVAGGATVRDTKHRAGGTVSFTSAAWEAFIAGLTRA
ncbi:hypothetical protein FHS29_002258 [Saccharothrix tamanrassetensis]|uniref:DUF397 domain-containing protein n=1 Tax=Saccharothrix tamanrassetensis TaxID=1051531 RepID=A0A841CHS3_9PSEU|nr:DUF397 domain-containing protein [Saccharothrix tamanrassetensis]MBB5955677.1 hypothetical protein [Saccharothrix tamanrassetensis]